MLRYVLQYSMVLHAGREGPDQTARFLSAFARKYAYAWCSLGKKSLMSYVNSEGSYERVYPCSVI